jgi:uncharacterized protein (TIGR03437 family)
VNGTAVPLVYVSYGQINAQMPVNVPTVQAVTLMVTCAGTQSNAITLSHPPAAPGIFTLNGTEAIVQNPSGSLNSPTTPAHPGDVLVTYLTGGVAVNSNSWITGAASPAGPASVSASNSLTVVDQFAQVLYASIASRGAGP